MEEKFDRKAASERIRIAVGDDDAHTVSTKTGIGINQVERILNGTDRMRSAEPLIRIAKAYNVSVDWIVGHGDQMRR